MPSADATATFALELDSSSAKSAAGDTAGALEELRGKLEADIEALRGMQQAMRNLKGSSSSSLDTMKALKDQITAQKTAIGAAQEKYIKLGGSLKDMSRRGKDGGDSLKSLLESVRSGGGPLDSLLSKVSGIRDMFGKAGMAGAAIVASAAVLALTVAVIAGIGALASYGLAQANAARSERLTLEGLTKIPNWYGLAAGSASQLQESINGVSASVALGRDKVSGYATELYRMGLRGQNLTDALEATSIASSAAGESYGGMVKGMLAGAAYTGQSVKKLADLVKDRFGGVAKAQMLDLNVQSAKLKESFSALFAGMHIEGFLTALNSVTQLFSQNTATGKALKHIIELIFDPMIAAVGKLGPMMKRFFQGMVIASQEFIIVVLKTLVALKQTFGTPSLFKGIDWMNVALNAGIVVGGVFVATLVTIAAALAIVGVSLALAFLPVIVSLALVGVVIAGTVLAVGWLITAFGKAYNWVASIDWGGLGASLIDGLVNGITSGVGRVVSAMKGLGASALKAFKEVTLIGSPSKAMRAYGVFTAKGAELGIEDGTPGVEKAARSMIEIPEAAAQSGGDRGGSAPARGGVQIAELHYHSSGPGNHQQDAEDFADKLRRTLEGVRITMGAPTTA